jgi:hypothetical protein
MSGSVPFLTPSTQVGTWQTFGEPAQTPLTQSPGAEQYLPFAHLPHEAPPQSTSVSLPFLTESEQVPVWHLSGEPEQTPLWQSLPAAHVLPSTHLPQDAPPQSVSVSLPFFTPSEQLDDWHLSGEPEQTPLWQSPATAHVAPAAHLPQEAPPQSMSVSTPFLTPSAHVGAWHTPAVQTPLWQSPGTEQVLALAHLPQEAPPQSTSVSVPFLTKSVQLAAWQMLPMHTPLWQSPALAQTLPAMHFTQVAPPQSMSLSVPFFTPSLHAAAWHFLGLPEQTPVWQSTAPVQS